MSILTIARNLNSNKSTVSYWCRDIILTSSQQKELAKEGRTKAYIGSLRQAEKQRKIRLDNIKRMLHKGQGDVGILNSRDLFILGLGLYWAEGYKKGSDETGFTNSDPVIISVILEWFKKIYAIEQKDFIARVSINQIHRDREVEIINFWSHSAKIDREQFTKTSFIKTVSKKIYPDSEKYFGTLRIKVRKGTELRRRIMGSLSFIGKNVTKIKC
ncbi:MAG: hypothetical protein PHF79_02395 [Candidatus Pacebacteria bacterium]|nr:hypothetical protein [Candidatus Paceibacterota bacterium]